MAKNFLIQILSRLIPLAAYALLLLLRDSEENLADLGQHGVFMVIFTVASLMSSGLTYRLMTHQTILENVFSNVIYTVSVFSYGLIIVYALLITISDPSVPFMQLAPLFIGASGLAQGVVSNYYIKINRHEILLYVNVVSVVMAIVLAYILKSSLPMLPAFIFFQSQAAILFYSSLKRIKHSMFRPGLIISLFISGRWFMIFSAGDLLFNIFFVSVFSIRYSMNEYGGFLLGKQIIFAAVSLVTASMTSFSLPFLSQKENKLPDVIKMYITLIVSTVFVVLVMFKFSDIILSVLGITSNEYIQGSIVFHSFFGLVLPILLFPSMFLNAIGKSKIMSVVEIVRRVILVLLFSFVALYRDMFDFLKIANILLLIFSLFTVYILRIVLPKSILFISYLYGLFIFIFLILFI